MSELSELREEVEHLRAANAELLAVCRRLIRFYGPGHLYEDKLDDIMD
jgi:hypothetical protein